MTSKENKTEGIRALMMSPDYAKLLNYFSAAYLLLSLGNAHFENGCELLDKYHLRTRLLKQKSNDVIARFDKFYAEFLPMVDSQHRHEDFADDFLKLAEVVEAFVSNDQEEFRLSVERLNSIMTKLHY